MPYDGNRGSASPGPSATTNVRAPGVPSRPPILTTSDVPFGVQSTSQTAEAQSVTGDPPGAGGNATFSCPPFGPAATSTRATSQPPSGETLRKNTTGRGVACSTSPSAFI